MLRQIFHDWNDSQSLLILRNIRGGNRQSKSSSCHRRGDLLGLSLPYKEQTRMSDTVGCLLLASIMMLFLPCLNATARRAWYAQLTCLSRQCNHTGTASIICMGTYFTSRRSLFACLRSAPIYGSAFYAPALLSKGTYFGWPMSGNCNVWAQRDPPLCCR